jgi:hypothetical protein
MADSLTAQERAAKYMRTIAQKTNASVVKTAGVDVMWFRTISQKRSEDVVFQTYTLHNVEPCPKTIKMLYNDTNYDDAALTFSYNGIEYKPSLTLEVPLLLWDEAYGDESIPQKHDIAYIPLTNKLWQVATMTPVSSAGQILSYKMMMETYTPSASRLVGGELEKAIDESTVSVDKLFGAALEEDMANITDKKQIGKFTSTVKDEYKQLAKTITPSEVIPAHNPIRPISEDVIIDGHTVARSYYDFSGKSGVMVRYKNISDDVNEGDMRCLSVWIRPTKSLEKIYYIDSISLTDRNRQYASLEVVFDDANKFKKDTYVTIESDPIVICGKILSVNSKSLCIETHASVIRNIETSIPNWYDMPDYTIKNESPINLLTGETENGLFSIDVMSRKYINILSQGRYYTLPLQDMIKEEIWYGCIINLSSKANVNIFNSEFGIEKEYEGNININWGDDTFTSYYINASDVNMTNIRYYNQENTDIDKQLTDLLSYNIKNDSKAIINDSADIYIDNPYYGEQR